MQRPWVLSEKVVWGLGFNALGALELTLLSLPFVIWPDRLADSLMRDMMAVGIGIVPVIDVWWRATGVQRGGWLRAILPSSGGTIFYLPGWIVAVGLACILIIAPMVHRSHLLLQ